MDFLVCLFSRVIVGPEAADLIGTVQSWRLLEEFEFTGLDVSVQHGEIGAVVVHDGECAVFGSAIGVIFPVGSGVGDVIGEWEILVEIVVAAAEVEGLGRGFVGALGNQLDIL